MENFLVLWHNITCCSLTLAVAETTRSIPTQSLQMYPTLGNSMDCSPTDSSVHGISQARILERDAMPSSRASSQLRD